MESQANQHLLTVNAATPGPRIDPLMYGIFWEELDFAGDGGVYAELVTNWNFEADASVPRYWMTIQTGEAIGQIALDWDVRLNDKQTRSLRVDITALPDGGRFAISNEGYWGIPVTGGNTYQFSFYARTAGDASGSIVATLENVDGTETYGRVVVDGIAGDWTRYSAPIEVDGEDRDGRLVLSFTEPGTYWLDIVSLFPPTHKDSLGVFREDLVNRLKELRPAFMRFPGGCYVQGYKDIDQAFDWKKSIGPIEERQGMYIMWSYFASGAMGYHEMLYLSELIGAEPIFVCNCGQTMNESVPDEDLDRWVQTAIDAIEYANGPVTSEWGGRRAANGHPEPFDMRIIQIGNEDAVPRFQADYDRHYALFREAILRRYPHFKIIQSVNHLTDDPAWNGQPADYVDHHFYRSPKWFVANVAKYDDYPRNHPAVFLGEVASMSADVGEGNLWGAIGEAAFLTGAERNAEVVRLVTYAPLLRNVNWRNWNPNMIMFDNARSYGIPSYYLWQMFMRNTGDVYLPSAISNNERVHHISLRGKVGVGTWKTTAEFAGQNLTLSDGQILIDDFGYGSANWQERRGDWTFGNGVLRQTSVETRCWAECEVADRDEYIYRLRARKISGAEGFQIPFAVNEEGGYLWNVGGWDNTRTSLMRTTGDSMVEVGNASALAIEEGRWYDIDIEVKGETIRCFLDGDLVHDYVVLPEVTAFLFASANRDNDTGDIIVKLVNSTAEHRSTRIVIDGAVSIAKGASAIVLASDDPTVENSFDEPTKVVPATKLLGEAGNDFVYDSPAYSVSIIRLKTA